MKHLTRTRPTLALAALLLSAIGGACGSSSNGGSSLPYFPPSPPTGPCGAVIQQRGIEGFNHVPECSFIQYQSLPPSSGDHYPVWAAYKTYTLPVPEGYWVHNLEHGAIVLSYNCAEAGCATDVAAAQQLIDGFPPDAACTFAPSASRPVHARLLMTPDPRLDVRFAASAWGWTLRANCFDAKVFLQFAKAHYGMGREPLCNDGEDVVGTTGAAAGCGSPH
jgi:hypothetical protein